MFYYIYYILIIYFLLLYINIFFYFYFIIFFVEIICLILSFIKKNVKFKNLLKHLLININCYFLGVDTLFTFCLLIWFWSNSKTPLVSENFFHLFKTFISSSIFEISTLKPS